MSRKVVTIRAEDMKRLARVYGPGGCIVALETPAAIVMLDRGAVERAALALGIQFARPALGPTPILGAAVDSRPVSGRVEVDLSPKPASDSDREQGAPCRSLTPGVVARLFRRTE